MINRPSHSTRETLARETPARETLARETLARETPARETPARETLAAVSQILPQELDSGPNYLDLH